MEKNKDTSKKDKSTALPVFLRRVYFLIKTKIERVKDNKYLFDKTVKTLFEIGFNLSPEMLINISISQFCLCP